MKVFIEPIGKLINEFSKLPGVGSKTAQRYAYKVINMTEEEAKEFANYIDTYPKSYDIGFQGAMIDYAHNALALKSLLEAMRIYVKGRLVCLFGCGGKTTMFYEEK